MKIVLCLIAPLFAAVCVTGCASTPVADRSNALEAHPRTRVALFDGRTGAKAEWADLVSAASRVDAVFIGETHSHPLGLAAIAALWDDLLAVTDAPALCLEFFERDQQAAIDDYLADIVDEDAFRSLARRTDGNYPPGHRAMIESAKALGRPVFAANAPRRYLRVGRDGYDGYDSFTDEQHRLFVIPDQMPGGEYRDDFFDVMIEGREAHGWPDDLTDEELNDRVEQSFRSQAIWDATMSGTVVRVLAQGYSPVVLVIGRFHVDKDGGTVQLFQRAAADASFIVVSVVDKAGETLEDDDLDRADFVLYVGEK